MFKRTISTLAAVLACSALASQAFAIAMPDRPVAFPADTATIKSIAESWPAAYGLHTTDLIRASFDCYGHFGAGFTPATTHPSFEVIPDNDASYLFAGAIWVGGIVGNDTLVSTGSDGWVGLQEMFPPGNPPVPSVTRLAHPLSSGALRAEFTDTNVTLAGADEDGRIHIPLWLNMRSRSYVWNTDTTGGIVIYDLVLTNVGTQIIHEGYIGFYMDADVCRDCYEAGGFDDDLCGFLADSAIAYIIDNNGDPDIFLPEQPFTVPRAFGFRFLASTVSLDSLAFNWWISNGQAAFDFGPRHHGAPAFPSGGTGTPVTDRIKYHVLSNGEIDYDQIFTKSITPGDSVWEYPPQPLVVDFSDGYDTRFLLSLGPLDLAPGQSGRVLFATFVSDSVHVDPSNAANLLNNPQAYLSGLDFSSLYETATAALNLVPVLLDPSAPPTRLELTDNEGSAVEVAWDPWIFPGIDGYSLEFGEISPGDLPYPGVIPPWYIPPVSVTTVTPGPDITSHRFEGLDPEAVYSIRIAHVTAGGTQTYGPPLYVRPIGTAAGPVINPEFTFYLPGNAVNLEWTPPGGMVDHYNIYRFDDTLPEYQVHHAFYDSGAALAYLPFDDIHVEGTDTFYYYAIEPFASAPGFQPQFSDGAPIDGGVYVISAVDDDGFESAFTGYVEAVETPAREHDILVVTHNNRTTTAMMVWDSVQAFYQKVLDGYDYALYNWADTATGGCGQNGYDCVDWRDFMRYRLLIIDDDIIERAFNLNYERLTRGFTKAVLSGTSMAYFGSLTGMLNVSITTAPGWYPTDQSYFASRFLPISSEYYAGPGYFVTHPPKVDNVFGFARAHSLVDTIPSLRFWPHPSPFSAYERQLWPPETPPSVSVFTATGGEVTHIAEVLPGAPTSQLKDQAVGLQFPGPLGQPMFLYGFHLWYMNPYEAQGLIHSIMPGPCCRIPGNADGLAGGTYPVAIGDLSFLVAALFKDGPQPPCPEEGDVDGSGSLNIADVTFLVHLLFKAGPQPPPCP